MLDDRAQAQTNAAAMVRGLGAFGTTAAALDRSRTVLAHTEDLTLDGAPFLLDCAGRLSGGCPACHVRFTSAFAETLAEGGSACALVDPGGAYRIVVRLRRIDADGVAALATITPLREMSFEAAPEPDLLCALFGLTPAEARLASLVAAAAPVTAAAARCGVSVKTARSSLERIYGKIGVRRQIELSRRLAVAAPPDGPRRALDGAWPSRVCRRS
jgi:DNA-binding CsgD family transcriptional regulator